MPGAARGSSRPSRGRRGLLRRWELALGLLLVSATAAWAWPKVERATWRTRRAEAELVLASLMDAVGDTRPSLPAFPRAPDAVGRAAVPWSGAPGAEGWRPPLPAARCAYAASGAGGDWHLVATCDVDGDGEPAVYLARPGARIERLTPEEVY